MINALLILMKRLLILLAMLTGFVQAYAQPGEVHFIRADISKGLSNNQVNTLYRDESGFMWIGTMSGLNRYDGYSFKVFRNLAGDTNSINDNYIDHIYPYPGKRLLIITRNGADVYDPLREQFERREELLQQNMGLPVTVAKKVVCDSKANYWFIFIGESLWQYTSAGKAVKYGAGAGSAVKLPEGQVSDVAEAPDGLLWIIYTNGLLIKLDWQQQKIVLTTDLLTREDVGPNTQYALFAAANGNCWIYKTSETDGIYRVSLKTAAGNPVVTHYFKESPEFPLNANIISGITEDSEGNTWIATDHGGINVVTNTGKIHYLVNNAEDPRSISQNSIVSLYRDKEGIIWVGTFKQGINYFNENLARFPLYKHLANTAGSLSYEDVNRFAEDAKGNLWIGTNGGGLIYFDRAKNSFKQYLAGSGSISNNVIVSLCIDHEQNLWIGSYFGGLDKFDGKRFINYRNNPLDSNSLADNRVWEIFEDSKHNLWVGTLSGGLDRFDIQKQIFIHYKAGQPNAIPSNYISALLEDKTGNLWIGTANGLCELQKNGVFVQYQNATGDVTGLSNNNVISLLQDSRGLIWAGTREGLSVIDPGIKKIRNFSKENGLPDNAILNILEDENGQVWISTPNGLCRIQIQMPSGNIAALSMKFTAYDELNNLQGREFNENAACKTSHGELIFGGPFGFNIFRPSEIAGIPHKPALLLTDLEVFNKSIKVGEKIKGDILLPQAVSSIKNITLQYSQNVFSIAFASLDFSHTEKDKYAYKLDGFNKDWLITDGNLRKATYTNLDPGNYVFHVKSVNNDGSLSQQEALLNIKILPPFWRTPLAFVIYFLLIAIALWFARRLVLQRAKMRFAIEHERQEARRMHELDLMKIRFITNVSHEFRTPLSLIISPVDKLVKQATDPAQKKQFQLIHRNARRLLNLVNQLLDFRKMEVQEFKFNPVEADIISFIRDISYSFTDIAEKKNIRFSFETSIEHQQLQFDPDKMEKILFNLLSNAYKFTPEGGIVGVEIDHRETQLGSLEGSSYLEIRVRDTGIGIAGGNKDKVFERFFQNEMPGNMLNQGSGIGLAIVKEFVRLHNGTIDVESELDKGSCFIIKLPVQVGMESGDTVINTVAETKEPGLQQLEPVTQKLRGKRATILIVEDNEDFRFYLKDNLGMHFHIAEAANGKEGWQQVQQLQPDLVVSDIMMPVMNGLDLAKKIKHDPRIAQTPVILLTARTAEEQQLEGLDTGANDYITKPFSFEILLSRIRNLLAEQKASEKPVKQITVSTADVQFESVDEKAIQHALEVVEKNMANADFSVEDLSRELLLSRVGLYKKMIALTGKTPIEFIRDIRMKRAIQLLEGSEMNIAEVAYEVGFNDPKYFARAFKKEYGVLPSQYAQEKRNNNGDIMPVKHDLPRF